MSLANGQLKEEKGFERAIDKGVTQNVSKLALSRPVSESTIRIIHASWGVFVED